ncbi:MULTISPECIES: helix-turn-helix transcriptional regulator [Sporosarcina]|uniref:PadR family transcriptional regulator n=1 Tax=Sporosarcina TaxID=1569 RepID=UPI0030D4B630
MTIQIYILSKLIEGNNYPYKLKRQLSDPIPFDKLAGLTESKLYYNFNTLAKQRLIEAVEIIKEEHRPDKQVFSITAKGREELPKKIYKLFEKADKISEMLVGLASIEYVDRDKVIAILERKLADHKDRWEYLKSLNEHVDVGKEKEKLMEFMGDYFPSKAEHTASWLEVLIDLIKQRKI